MPFTDRPGLLAEPVDVDATREYLKTTFTGQAIDNEDLYGYLMYPKVFADYMERHEIYGPVRTLPTDVFLYGMQPGEEISVEIDPGKTLEIRHLTTSEPNDEGIVKVFFEINGQPRTVRVADKAIFATKTKRPKADATNKSHVGAPMPGAVVTVAVQSGSDVKAGDLLLTIEAMKMESSIRAEQDGVVSVVHIQPGSQIDAKDLLVEFEV